MKKMSIFIICIMFAVTNIFAQGVKTDIEKAQKSGKSIFLVVTDKLAKGTDELVKIAKDVQKIKKDIAVIRLDRNNKANADLISKYRLAGVTLPLILVIAPNGVATGGLNVANASKETLIKYLPTKTQAEVLYGFEHGKAAFIVCGKKGAKDRAAIEAECKKAVVNLGNKATQVFVDVDNKEEANFLALIKPDVTKTTVLVFNGKGQFTGTLQSNATTKELLATAKKQVSGCCSSGGSCGK